MKDLMGKQEAEKVSLEGLKETEERKPVKKEEPFFLGLVWGFPCRGQDLGELPSSPFPQEVVNSLAFSGEEGQRPDFFLKQG